MISEDFQNLLTNFHLGSITDELGGSTSLADLIHEGFGKVTVMKQTNHIGEEGKETVRRGTADLAEKGMFQHF